MCVHPGSLRSGMIHYTSFCHAKGSPAHLIQTKELMMCIAGSFLNSWAGASQPEAESGPEGSFEGPG